MMILKNNKNITSEILFVLLILLFKDGNGSCTIKLDERGPKNDHPMILDIHGKIVYPTDGRKLSFSKPILIIECPINVLFYWYLSYCINKYRIQTTPKRSSCSVTALKIISNPKRCSTCNSNAMMPS